VSVALYATIWAALALFIVGEAGKRGCANGVPTGVPWLAWTLGAGLCVLHMGIALGARHGWNHAAAVAETARQTEEVYGLAWGGGVYVNYLFAALWLAEAAWWRADPRSYFRRPRWSSWLLRGFYFVILVNAALVFASPAGRIAGVPLVLALAWTWRPSRGLAGSAERAR
jgi:hypothetical protein